MSSNPLICGFHADADKIFGVDLMLSYPQQTTDSSISPEPVVTLLEYNASPDFHQSGDRLRKDLGELFKGVVNIAIAPFFDLQTNDGHNGDGDIETVEGDAWGWRQIGKGQIRGPEQQ
jgi:tubulin--tyrosine ligase